MKFQLVILAPARIPVNVRGEVLYTTLPAGAIVLSGDWATCFDASYDPIFTDIPVKVTQDWELRN
jgi:hypothetical protein